jgi:hypothetical protein
MLQRLPSQKRQARDHFPDSFDEAQFLYEIQLFVQQGVCGEPTGKKPALDHTGLLSFF